MITKKNIPHGTASTSSSIEVLDPNLSNINRRAIIIANEKIEINDLVKKRYTSLSVKK